MKVFIGMETSGVSRRAFEALGHDVISCDLLPAQDKRGGRHIVGDVFAALEQLRADGWWPDLAIFHPDCTYLTVSAAWAFKDPDFERYPGVGYHQKVKPGTLTGAARREARDKAVILVKRIWSLSIKRIAIENPIGALSKRFMKPSQIVQPWQFGDDASKATCLWLRDLPTIKATEKVPGRLVEWPRGSGKMVERWSNQTDSGQNKLTPGDTRWQARSDTFGGIAAAFSTQWTAAVSKEAAVTVAA
ncbi:hypothetical protein [Rhizobium sp. 18065]|uniref:hypothetical protein n=1 Tax=Rhizobium sp. 18065 TaxID=2681411 RepID=UPI0013567586|nr:hypothetical protein [Rhizobium sp. 18065]